MAQASKPGIYWRRWFTKDFPDLSVEAILFLRRQWNN